MKGIAVADCHGGSAVKKLIRNILALAFVGYMLLLIYFLFFSEEYGRTVPFDDYQYNFTPFREISRYIRYRDVVGWYAFLINIVGNVVVFMPFGFFVPGLEKKKSGPVFEFFKITVLGFFFSMAVETIQLVTKVGCFDVDDLMLNTVGVALGCICYKICHAIFNWFRRCRNRRRENGGTR